MKKIAIIGGGLAGLSAGVELAEQGMQVTLFESRPILGGRAYSVLDKTTVDVIDNGQHLFMGCYHHTFDFFKKIGTFPLLQFQNKMEVVFATPEGKSFSLTCPNLPAPLHLLVGLLRLKTLSFKEKIQMIWMVQKVRALSEKDLEDLDALDCEQWLRSLKQSESSIKNFWEPLIIATINETPQQSSAKMLAVVLREALLKKKQDSLMVLSTVGLSDLYTQASQKFIEDRGGQILTSSGVSKLLWNEEKIQKMILHSGEEKNFDNYVCALPPNELEKLFAHSESHPFFSALQEFEFSPIFSINLWFDRPILNETFIGFLDSPLHWIFKKGQILGKASHYVSIVISAADFLKDKSHDDLLNMALEEIHKALP
ncbi:MAG: FAD-dependent oxidoreductase, partial [Deltaproteobacteria bacterium]|nr:FAD-dependent oxidoreductase [Deltaproteobacteria bacterium]